MSRDTTEPRCRFCARPPSPAITRPTSSGSSTRCTGSRRMDASTIASACCARPARFARRRPSGARGQHSSPSRAWIRCAPSRNAQQHPGKMWVVRGRRMTPLLPLGPADQPWHSSQYPSLPEVYVQNASLEIAWTRVVFDERTIAGNVRDAVLHRRARGFRRKPPLRLGAGGAIGAKPGGSTSRGRPPCLQMLELTGDGKRVPQPHHRS